jgi:hypothetical protein
LGSLGYDIGTYTTHILTTVSQAKPHVLHGLSAELVGPYMGAVFIGFVLAVLFNCLLGACLFAGLGAICGAIGATIGKQEFLQRQAATTPPMPPSPPAGPRS